MTSTTTSFSSQTPNVVSGTTTSWLPITTAWPSITQCTDVYSVEGQNPVAAYNPEISGINVLIRCLPPEAVSWYEQVIPTPHFTVTSIGPIVCPVEYYTVTEFEVDSLSTSVICCPSNYTYASIANSFGECTSTATEGLPFYTGAESSGPWGVYDPLSSSMGDPAKSIPSMNVTAPPVNGFKFAQNSIAASSTTTSAASTSSNPPGGLSTGAKAGIGVGVSLGALGIFSAIGAWFYMRRVLRRSKSSPTEAESNDGALKPEMDAQGTIRRFETDSVGLQELDASEVHVREMDAGAVRKPVVRSPIE